MQMMVDERQQQFQVAPGPLGDVAFRTYGMREATKLTLVLIHGWLQAGVCWRRQIPVLAEQYYVVVVDLPGHGQSAGPTGQEEEVPPALWSQSVQAVLHTLRLDETPLVLIGWSFGGVVISQYVCQYGTQHLRGIVTVGTTLASFAQMPTGAAQASELMCLLDPSSDAGARLAAFEQFQRGLTSHPLPQEEYYLTSGYNMVALRKLWSISVDWVWSAAATGAEQQVREAGIPTLIIQGTRDAFVPVEVAQSLHRALPHSTLQLLDCGHSPFLEMPHTFNCTLLNFLDTLS